jgi:heavy metal sensor kinase
VAVFRLLRVRLTLFYLLLLAGTLAAFSAGVYLALRESLFSSLDDSIETRLELVSALLASQGGIDAAGVDIPGDPVEGEEFVRIFGENGENVLDNTHPDYRPPVDEEAVRAALAGSTTRRSAEAGGVTLRTVTAPVRSEGKVVGAIEVGMSEDDAQETLGRLLLIIAVLYPAALIVAGGGGFVLAGRALRPIGDVTEAARRITAEDLGRRLDLDLPDDEVGRLARTFDEMIARLDAAFQRQRQFTADASHELRTPLTAIKGEAEVALQRDRSPDDYRDTLRRVNGEVDRMIRLLGSLLTLARADAAQVPVNREPVDIEGLASEAIAQVRPAAGEKGIALNAHGGAVTISADRGLLLQLLLNLLDNAARATPAGGSIDITWQASADGASISVADSGPGIPPEHLAHVFERFYRADPARSREQGGAGLGLAICKWIAETHGGTISAKNGPEGGAIFIVSLPRA